MMDLTIGEFMRVCNNNHFRSFFIDTRSSENYIGDIGVRCSFDMVISMINPNRICFKSNENTLWFNRVKRVKYDYNGGCHFIIICGNLLNQEDDIFYDVIGVSC